MSLSGLSNRAHAGLTLTLSGSTGAPTPTPAFSSSCAQAFLASSTMCTDNLKFARKLSLPERHNRSPVRSSSPASDEGASPGGALMRSFAQRSLRSLNAATSALCFCVACVRQLSMPCHAATPKVAAVPMPIDAVTAPALSTRACSRLTVATAPLAPAAAAALAAFTALTAFACASAGPICPSSILNRSCVPCAMRDSISPSRRLPISAPSLK